MSEPQARYQRSTRGMVGALVAVLLAVAAYVGFGGLLQNNQPSPVPTVDYHGWLRSGRDDAKLQVLAPAPLPAGWRATSAQYATGSEPRWHLGLLTETGRYVGLEEQWAEPRTMVQQYVSTNATPGKTVVIAGRKWKVWTDRRGDYAVVNTRPSRVRRHPETVLVVGDAPPAQIRAFARSLSAG